MIEGIGVDIVSVNRIKKLYEKFGVKFLNKIFTDKEITYCLSHANPYPHFAARFAVKEAVIKALKKPEALKLKDIEILNKSDGSPIVILNNYLQNGKHLPEMKTKVLEKILVSISHEKEYAIAFITILKEIK